MSSHTINQGDTEPFVLQVLDDDDEPVSLVGKTVKIYMRARGGDAVVIAGACSLVDAALGIVSYPWGFGETDTPGRYEVQLDARRARAVGDDDELDTPLSAVQQGDVEGARALTGLSPLPYPLQPKFDCVNIPTSLVYVITGTDEWGDPATEQGTVPSGSGAAFAEGYFTTITSVVVTWPEGLVGPGQSVQLQHGSSRVTSAQRVRHPSRGYIGLTIQDAI